MMKNGKKDMSDKLKLKGHMKAFMRWPLILSALLIVLNIWVYFVSVKAGIIVSGGILIYVGCAVIILRCHRPFIVNELIAFANQYVGYPYVWGGTDPNTGADCSGFVYYVLKNFGINYGRLTSYGWRSVGQEVSVNNMQPGDIVCYAGHVAIYAGGGRIVEAQSTSAGITNNRSVYCHNIITVRRVL